MTTFQNNGYFIEFMIGDKYQGSIRVMAPDREKFGYEGRIDSVANEDIVLDNGKTIKKGTSYFTRLYPICGKRNGTGSLEQ